MNTTKEDHTLTCTTCAAAIGPCEQYGCINRYDHENGLCPACETEEIGKEWKD